MKHKIGIFAAGALIGAAACYLLNTPQGRELRSRARDGALKVLDMIEEKIRQDDQPDKDQ